MDGTQLVGMSVQASIAEAETGAGRLNPDRVSPLNWRTNSSSMEVMHGTWRCRISPDTSVRVTSQRRLTAPILLSALGTALMILGMAFGFNPGFILAGGTLALFGADSCRRVRRVYTVVLENGGDKSQFLSFADAGRAQKLVLEISAEVKRLRSTGKHPPATERPQIFGAHAS